MLAAIEFAAAGLSAGKTEHYGLGVMRDIAVRLTCQADPGELHTIGDAPDDAPQPTPRYERIVGLGRLINDEIYGQSGTHARLLIDRQRVYDVYRDGLAFQARRRGPLAMGAVGHGIVARTLGETEAQLAFAIEAEPAPEA